MLNETRVALRGNVATEPALTVTRNGTTVCSFRLAVTARRYSASDNKVVDAETSWYTVTCWRGLAENVVSSLAKGQGVLVQGRLRVRDFVHDDQPRTSADVTADVVGVDLTWGTTTFTPNRRTRADDTRDDVDRADADELAAHVSVSADGGTTVDGRRVDPATGELLDEQEQDGRSAGGDLDEDRGEDGDGALGESHDHVDPLAGADGRYASARAAEPAF